MKIEKLDTFGCTIIIEEGRPVNVLNDKVAEMMFKKINEIIDVVNGMEKVKPLTLREIEGYLNSPLRNVNPNAQ